MYGSGSFMSAEVETSEPKLRQLLEAVAQGDGPAFRSLVVSTGAQVYGTLLRFTGDEVAAASLLQATYEEVWRLAPCYDRQSGPVMLWIVGLCRSQIVEHGQKHRRGDFAPRGPATVSDQPGDFDVLERCWFGGLRTGPAGAGDRDRFSSALRRLAAMPLSPAEDGGD